MLKYFARFCASSRKLQLCKCYHHFRLGWWFRLSKFDHNRGCRCHRYWWCWCCHSFKNRASTLISLRPKSFATTETNKRTKRKEKKNCWFVSIRFFCSTDNFDLFVSNKIRLKLSASGCLRVMRRMCKLVRVKKSQNISHFLMWLWVEHCADHCLLMLAFFFTPILFRRCPNRETQQTRWIVCADLTSTFDVFVKWTMKNTWIGHGFGLV